MCQKSNNKKTFSWKIFSKPFSCTSKRESKEEEEQKKFSFECVCAVPFIFFFCFLCQCTGMVINVSMTVQGLYVCVNQRRIKVIETIYFFMTFSFLFFFYPHSNFPSPLIIFINILKHCVLRMGKEEKKQHSYMNIA